MWKRVRRASLQADAPHATRETLAAKGARTLARGAPDATEGVQHRGQRLADAARDAARVAALLAPGAREHRRLGGRAASCRDAGVLRSVTIAARALQSQTSAYIARGATFARCGRELAAACLPSPSGHVGVRPPSPLAPRHARKCGQTPEGMQPCAASAPRPLRHRLRSAP